MKIEKITPEIVCALAIKKVQALNLPTYSSPKEALYKFPWNIENDTCGQKDIAERNLSLDERSCFGRVVLAAALIKLQFPEVKVEYAEVLSDQLRADMLKVVHSELLGDPASQSDYFKEVLLYEEPHLIIVIDGVQFDPLSTLLSIELCHPRIETYPLWEGIASAMIVSQAWLEEGVIKKITLLEMAEKLCPGTTLVAENRVGCLISLEKFAEAVALLNKIYAKRPTARALFTLCLLTGDQKYRLELDKEYTPFMYKLLTEEFRCQVSKAWRA